MAEVISESNIRERTFFQSPVKLHLGRLGMILLGSSFLIWAIILATGSGTGFSYAFTVSPLMNWLGFSTIALTAGGLVLVNIGLNRIASRRKPLVRYSTFFFVWMNILGFYLAYNSLWGGPFFTSPMAGMYVVSSGLVFLFYIAIFSVFLGPFLTKLKKVMLLASAALNVLFIAAITMFSYSAMHVPVLGLLPGANFPFVLQLINPSFGFPWFQINFAGLQGISIWVYVLPVISNLILCSLYFTAVVKPLGHQALEEGSGTGTI